MVCHATCRLYACHNSLKCVWKRIIACKEKYSACKGQTAPTYIPAWKHYLGKKEGYLLVQYFWISTSLSSFFLFEPFLAKANSEQSLLAHTGKQIILMYWKSINIEKLIIVIHKIFLCTSSPEPLVSYSCSNSQPLIDTYFSPRQNPKSEICVLVEWMCLVIMPCFLIHLWTYVQVMIMADSRLLGRKDWRGKKKDKFSSQLNSAILNVLIWSAEYFFAILRQEPPKNSVPILPISF